MPKRWSKLPTKAGTRGTEDARSVGRQMSQGLCNMRSRSWASSERNSSRMASLQYFGTIFIGGRARPAAQSEKAWGVTNARVHRTEYGGCLSVTLAVERLDFSAVDNSLVGDDLAMRVNGGALEVELTKSDR